MSPFQKWLLWGSSLATAVTGVVYAWMKYLMEPSDPWAVINHPWQPVMLKAHILVAPVLVFAFGLIAVDHVWKHYRCRVPMGRRSGILAALFFFPMVASGYLIQAVTHAGWLKALVIAHLATSALYTVGLVAHQKVFRRRTKDRERRRGEPAIKIGPAEGEEERVHLVLPDRPDLPDLPDRTDPPDPSGDTSETSEEPHESREPGEREGRRLGA